MPRKLTQNSSPWRGMTEFRHSQILPQRPVVEPTESPATGANFIGRRGSTRLRLNHFLLTHSRLQTMEHPTMAPLDQLCSRFFRSQANLSRSSGPGPAKDHPRRNSNRPSPIGPVGLGALTGIQRYSRMGWRNNPPPTIQAKWLPLFPKGASPGRNCLELGYLRPNGRQPKIIFTKRSATPPGKSVRCVTSAISRTDAPSMGRYSSPSPGRAA